MGKITQEQRNRYFEKVKEHRKTIEAGLAKEKTLLDLLSKDESGAGYKRLMLANDALDLCSWYMLVNGLSVSLLGIKNEDYLLEARKTLVRSDQVHRRHGFGLSRRPLLRLRGEARRNTGLRLRGEVSAPAQARLRGSVARGRLRRELEVLGLVHRVVGKGSDGREESRQSQDGRIGHGFHLAVRATAIRNGNERA